MERVRRGVLAQWAERRTGPGGDPRLLGITRDAQDVPVSSLRDALHEMRHTITVVSPLRGPPAIVELLDAIRGSGEEIARYHEFWLKH